MIIYSGHHCLLIDHTAEDGISEVGDVIKILVSPKTQRKRIQT